MLSQVVLNISKIQFKSNSQLSALQNQYQRSCAQYLKDTIQKQFTTLRSTTGIRVLLCSISQRYNSKAIHNSLYRCRRDCHVVLNISKIQFKSNSQLMPYFDSTSSSCAQYLKDTIQKQFTTKYPHGHVCSWLCSISQRYNSKAIHNPKGPAAPTGKVVLNISKIQFKSNSQQIS